MQDYQKASMEKDLKYIAEYQAARNEQTIVFDLKSQSWYIKSTISVLISLSFFILGGLLSFVLGWFVNWELVGISSFCCGLAAIFFLLVSIVLAAIGFYYARKGNYLSHISAETCEVVETIKRLMGQQKDISDEQVSLPS